MASHAFLGDLTQPMPPSWKFKRPPPKTSSERGRKFRARQRERELTVERHVTALRHEIQALAASKSLFYEQLLRTRSAHDGSIQRRIRECFSILQDGLPARVDAEDSDPRREQRAERVRLKEDYMRAVFDPDTLAGDSRGVSTVIDQWRRYTVFHGRFHLDPGRIDVVGPDDDREFRLHVKLTVRITRKTFEHVFPVALSDEALVQKFLNREVQYDCVVRMRFSDEGCIIAYFLDVDFIRGLRRVCDNLEDVANLLSHSKITLACTLRDRVIERPVIDRPVIDRAVIDTPLAVSERAGHRRLMDDSITPGERHLRDPHATHDRKPEYATGSQSPHARTPYIGMVAS